MKNYFCKLRKNFYHPNYTNFTSLFESVEVPEISSVDTLTYFDIPRATIEDDIIEDADVESEVKTDEDKLEE